MASNDFHPNNPQDPPLIQCLHMWKWFIQGHNVFQDTSLQINKGELAFLMAPSGGGKSTLIRMLIGLEPVNRGHILFQGRSLDHMSPKELPYFRRRIGVVMQDLKLLNHRSVFENASLPLDIAGKERTMVRKKVAQLLHALALDHKMNMLCAQLSRGEQYLLAIARAVANDPVLLLVDEPSGNLEEDTLGDVMTLFLTLRGRGTTVVIASHEPTLPQLVPDARVLAIHDGRVLERTLSPGKTHWR